MSPIITDYLFFILAAVCVYGFCRSFKNPLWQQAYRELAQSSVAVSCTIVLGLYCTIGLLDSIRFHSADQIIPITILDRIMAPQAFEPEISYSAPFATRLLDKTIQVDDAGHFHDIPSRLTHGGDHLLNPDDHPAKISDIAKRSFKSMILSAVIVLCLWLPLHRISLFSRFKRSIHQLAFWITLSVCLAAILVLLALKSHYHVFGTDKIGRDVLYLSLKSIRTGLLVGGITLGIAMPIATFCGIVSGYRGGWVDDLIQFGYTVISSIPGILLIAAAILAFQTKLEESGDLRLLLLCVVLGLTGWVGLCRILRAETLKIREMEYIQSARLLGCHTYTLLKRYVLPNVFHLILISFALDFSGLVLAEAILSYVGIGLDASSISWGTMINSARLELSREPTVWWSLVATLFSMSLLVISLNLLADELQKTLDPRRRYVK